MRWSLTSLKKQTTSVQDELGAETALQLISKRHFVYTSLAVILLFFKEGHFRDQDT